MLQEKMFFFKKNHFWPVDRVVERTKSGVKSFIEQRFSALVSAVVVREDALWQLHSEDDAQNDGDGHFARSPSTLHREVELGIGEIIGKPEDAGTGH